MKNTILSSVLKNVVLIAFISVSLLSFGQNETKTPRSSQKHVSSFTKVYKGALDFISSDGGIIQNAENGEATVYFHDSIIYKITFSDGVSALLNLKIKTKNACVVVDDIQEGWVMSFVLNQESMALQLTTEGNTWSFSGEK